MVQKTKLGTSIKSNNIPHRPKRQHQMNFVQRPVNTTDDIKQRKLKSQETIIKQ